MNETLKKLVTTENAVKAEAVDWDEYTILEIMGIEPTGDNTIKYENDIEELSNALDTEYLDYISEL